MEDSLQVNSTGVPCTVLFDGDSDKTLPKPSMRLDMLTFELFWKYGSLSLR